MDGLLKAIGYDSWREPVVQGGGRLLVVAAMLLVGLWLARRIARLVRLAIERRGGDAVLATFVRNCVYVALLVVVVVGALDLAGVPTASLLAAIGAAGLAIGLALKDSLGNLASGVLLIVTRPFRAGDFVEAAGRSGTVQRIELLQTVLLTPDNCDVMLPNAQVMSAPIVNYSARPLRRLDLLLAVAYEDDPLQAIAVIRETLAAHPLVQADPEPQLLVLKLAASGVELAVRPWVRTPDYWRAHSELTAAIKAALDARGITIPYPQQVMRMLPVGEPVSATRPER